MNLKYTVDQVSEALSNKRKKLLNEYLESENFRNDLIKVEQELELAMSFGNCNIDVKEISKPDLMADFLKENNFLAFAWGENNISITVL